MKTKTTLLLLCFCSFLFVGCSLEEMETLPSIENISEVKVGMGYVEIKEIIGPPKSITDNNKKIHWWYKNPSDNTKAYVLTFIGDFLAKRPDTTTRTQWP